jgi:flagellar motility protein MotE (MotC chaperone)
MTERGFIPTFAALFGLVAAGQGLAAVSGIEQLEIGATGRTDLAEASSRVRSMTRDGILIVDDFAEGDAITESSASDREYELRAQQAEVNREVARLKRERSTLEIEKARLDEIKQREQERLAQLYARMPAQKAAEILSALTPEEAAGFVGVMPGDSGAAILALMPSETAVAVTRELLKKA